SFCKHAARHDLPVDTGSLKSGGPESMVAAALETFKCSYLAEHGVLICIDCQCALHPDPDRIANHLRRIHNHQSQMVGSAARLFFDHLRLKRIAELRSQSRPHFLPPIPHLPVKDGFICTICKEYCCAAMHTMELHVRNAHGWKPQDGIAWEACKVQIL